MQKMKALTAMRYATRRLQAGDTFEAKPKDVRVLEAIRKAKVLRDPVDLSPPPAALVAKVMGGPDDDLSAARDEYQAVIGKRPYHGWDVATLREKIAAHGAD